jgi:tRNA 2-selenouridine synthase
MMGDTAERPPGHELQRSVQRSPLIDIQTALDQYPGADWIDARSESEFALDHVPGAINLPALHDAERVRIGTLHKQASPFEARREGAALVARNIAHYLEARLRDCPPDWQPVVYCWRGGKRSGAWVTILRQIGWRAWQLDGGYKAFRRHVMTALEAIPAQFRFRVLVGPTGSGKSRLLEYIEGAGGQVLDLEALACHRGSVLGGVPDQPQPTQKQFETRVWDALRRCDPARPVFVEAESRKIGLLRVPEQLMMAMRAADCVVIDTSVAARTRFLCAEYRYWIDAPQALAVQLRTLREHVAKEELSTWDRWIAAGTFEALVERLLCVHYDPLYRLSSQRNFSQLAPWCRSTARASWRRRNR